MSNGEPGDYGYAASVADLIPNFDAPRCTLRSIAINVVNVLALPNADRFAIGFQMNSGTTVLYLPDPAVTTAFGFLMNTSMSPHWYIFPHHAILVPCGWYCRSAGAATVTVVEIFYKPRR